MDAGQLHDLIRRTLLLVGLHSEAAVELLMGTAAHESHLGTYLRQINGPALGIFQMEPDTERDIWINYLRFRPIRIDDVVAYTGVNSPSTWALETNLAYQIIMARLQYRRVKAPLPPAGDIRNMSLYWDAHYNCNPDKGHPDQFVTDYYRYLRVKKTISG